MISVVQEANRFKYTHIPLEHIRSAPSSHRTVYIVFQHISPSAVAETETKVIVRVIPDHQFFCTFEKIFPGTQQTTATFEAPYRIMRYPGPRHCQAPRFGRRVQKRVDYPGSLF